MRIKIGDKIYAPVAPDEVSLKELMLFNIQAREFGLTWNEAAELLDRFDKMDAGEAEADPDIFLVIGVTLWMVRRAAGEDLTFSEAVDVDMAKVDFIPDPEDMKPGKPKGAKKAPKASARAGKPSQEVSSDKTSAAQESESQSIPA